MSLSDSKVSVTELSIADVHTRFAQGLLTCTELTHRLLQRIERYDKQGPCLNALLTVSPHAIETARQKDREYGSNPAAVGPLHGIPVIVKDNYNTADLPTTAGSVVLAQSRPLHDCFVVQQLRRAGALILAKANLTELAMGGTTVSSLAARRATRTICCTRLEGQAVGRRRLLRQILASSGPAVIPASRFAHRRLRPIWSVSVQRAVW